MEAVIPFAGCFTRPDDAPSPWVFLGLPDDSQSSFLKGCAEAPQRIREAYDGRCYNATSESGIDLTRSVIDMGDLKPGTTWLATLQDYRARLESLLQEGKTPFCVGGDHAVTVPVVAALEALAQPVHVIQVDAHPDLYIEFEDNPDSHACTAARILEMGHVASVTQLGVRTMNEEQSRQLEGHSHRLRIYEARDLPGELPPLEHIPEGAGVYITIDMDGFDPAYAPGVSHPVPGGLSARQVLSFLQRGHWTLVGMDVVEVNPSRDIHSQTAILAARLIHEGIAYAAGRHRAK